VPVFGRYVQAGKKTQLEKPRVDWGQVLHCAIVR
jgi:hypothetical protein